MPLTPSPLSVVPPSPGSSTAEPVEPDADGSDDEDDEFGEDGSDDEDLSAAALAPHEVSEPNPENEATASIAQKELKRLGYDGPRAALLVQGDRAFAEMAGGARRVTQALFINHATQHWGWDALTALAAFKACDLDKSGALGRHEYLLLRAALVHHGAHGHRSKLRGGVCGGTWLRVAHHVGRTVVRFDSAGGGACGGTRGALHTPVVPHLANAVTLCGVAAARVHHDAHGHRGSRMVACAAARGRE